MPSKLPIIPLTHQYFRSIKQVFIGTAFGVLIFQLMNLIQPNHGELKPLFDGHITAYIKDVLLYYYCFEWVSVFIFFKLAQLYFKVFSMNQMPLSWGHFSLYLIKCIPLILVSILVIAPVTNGLRFLIYKFPNYSWQLYYPKYFLHSDLYVLYVVPLLIFGLGFIIFNLFVDYSDWQANQVNALKQARTLVPNEASAEVLEQGLSIISGYDDKGEYPVKVQDIWWFEVDNRNYYAYTEGHTYQVSKTLVELENELNPQQFFRVNRSVIINIEKLKNYQYWENDKYKLRMKDDKTEFVIQRVRLNELKKKINLI